MHVIGLDIGTTGCKACVFDENGTILGYGFRDYPVICTEPAMGEQDAENVWNLTTEVLKEAAGKAGVPDIKALCVSVQGDAIIAVDADFRALHPAILGMDYRPEKQARMCAEKLGDRALFDRTGMRPHPMNSVVKMVWLKENRPAVFSAAARIVTYADYITGRLCGEARIDYTMASRTMGFDLHARHWAREILDSLGIDSALLSQPAASGSIAGTIRPAIADRCGLPRTCAIVTGGHDQACAALGAGVIDGGTAVLSSGTAEVLSAAFTQDVDRGILYESYYPQYLHAAPGAFFTFALNHSGGISFRWYRDTLGIPEKTAALEQGIDPYTAIINAMPPGPSPVFFVPHFNGSPTPTCDMNARAIIAGMSLSTSRHDIAKALLEGLCFEMRINIDRMKSAGIVLDRLVAVGGGAKSPEWLQMRADIFGRPIQTLEVREAACLGAALLAGCAVGMYGSLSEAVGRAVVTKNTFEPDALTTRLYQERFIQYCRIYPALRSAQTIPHARA